MTLTMTTQRLVLDDERWKTQAAEVSAQLQRFVRRGSIVCCPPSTDGRTHLSTAAGMLVGVTTVEGAVHVDVQLLSTIAGRLLETACAKGEVLRPVLRGMGSGPDDFVLSGVDIAVGRP